MRFVFLSNFTGHPAISLPVGHAPHGMTQLHSTAEQVTPQFNLCKLYVTSYLMLLSQGSNRDFVF